MTKYRILLTISILVFCGGLAKATTPYLKLGYAIYVGGLHIGNIETHLYKNKDIYTFYGYARTANVTDFIARLRAVSTSKGHINTDGTYTWTHHTNTSTARFGDNYSILTRGTEGKTTLTRYPDRNEINLQNLDGDPLSQANDPMATVLNMMVQTGNTGTCSQDLVLIANHFLYRMNTIKSYSSYIKSTPYNLASGDTLACDLRFVRLDKEQGLSAYKKIQGNGDGQERPPTLFFKKIPPVPYALPVLIRAKEQRFGAFRMHLQFIQYDGKTLQAEKWNPDLQLSHHDTDILKTIRQNLTQ